MVAPESRATALLHAGADQRRLGADQRHRLALHVRAHQRAVGVVVLEERDQRRGDRDELLRRDVDQVDVLRPGQHELAAARGSSPDRRRSWPLSSSSALAWAMV